MGMAAELKSLRSTMEFMAEQVSKLVALGSQQLEAVADIVPLVPQSADRISGDLRDVVSAIQSISRSLSPAAQPTKPDERAMPSPGHAGIETTQTMPIWIPPGAIRWSVISIRSMRSITRAIEY
jgi:hypothetical protein